MAAGWPKATFTTAKWPVAVTQTTIFYSKDSQKATAEAVAKSLRVGTAEKTTRDTGAGVALVLGPDAGDVVPG